jgi:hypothetical protein
MTFVEACVIGLIFSIGQGFKYFAKAKGARAPINEKLLRSPGHSLFLKMENYDEQLMVWILLLFLAPSVFVWQSAQLPSTWVVGLSLAMIVCLIIPVVRLVRSRKRCRLGLAGELAVGEELNKLMREGCYVFHDYPDKACGNIDHVVIAPSGVYAIETKAKTKHRCAANEKDYRLEFDGQQVIFPGGYRDTAMLEQARRNAEILGEQLSAATAEQVKVRGVLVFPGWLVERTGKGDVSVLNPKEVEKMIQSRAVLTKEQIQRISAFIEGKCRDVDAL